MTRIMFDAIYPDQAPAGADIYAGYVGGNWPDFNGMKTAHPGKLYVSIAVNASERAKMLDVETGDASPAEAPGWVLDQRAAGDPFPWVYMSESVWPQVQAAFAAQKVAPPLYVVASYSSLPPDLAHPPAIPVGAIGLQAYDYGGYDISFVAGFIPGFDPDPAPIPAPSLVEDSMRQQLVYDEANRQQHYVYIAGGAVWHRVFDETSRKWSEPSELPGVVDPAAGVDAKIMMGGGQLHAFATFADTAHGTGAHYWLGLPVDVAKAEAWGHDVV